MTGFFDTNILIDFLNGLPDARSTLDSHTHRIISRITWMNVMAGVKDTKMEDTTRRSRRPPAPPPRPETPTT